MSFLDKLHRNDLLRDQRPDEELKKLFKGKGRNRDREQQEQEDQQENGNAVGRLARAALGKGVEQLQGKVDDVQEKVQGTVDDVQGTIDDAQGVARDKFPGKGEKVHDGIDAAQAKVDQGVAWGQGKVDDGQAAVQKRVDKIVKKKSAPHGAQEAERAEPQQQSEQPQQQEAKQEREQVEREQQDAPATEKPEKKKKRSLLGTLAKVGIKPEVKIGGFEVGIDEDSINIDGRAGEVDIHGEQQYGKGKKLGRDAHVTASGSAGAFDGTVTVSGTEGVSGTIGAEAQVGPADVRVEQEFGRGKRLGRDASLEARAEVLGFPVKGGIDGDDVFKDKQEQPAVVAHEATHVEQQRQGRVEKPAEALSDREKLARQVLDGGMEIAKGDAAWTALAGIAEQAIDESGAGKKIKKPGERLLQVALGNDEDKLGTDGTVEEKPASANDKAPAAEQEKLKAKDNDKDKDETKDDDKAEKSESESEHEEDENKDSKRLPGKVGAVHKAAKRELELHGRDAKDFAAASKKKLADKTLAHHDKQHAVDAERGPVDKKKQLTKTPDGHGMGVDIGPVGKQQAGVDLDGDGKPDKLQGKHKELEHHGLLREEDEQGELEDGDGGKVAYNPMKSKGAPAPKASKGAQPGGHAKPPAPPQLPDNLTSKNQAAINGYIAQAKRDRDAAKGKVQKQQLAKSQAVAVDAKAIAAQVKQKNDQRLGQLRQQTEAKKAQAAQEAKERQAKEGPVTLESLKEKLETKATEDKQKLKDSFETKRTELGERIKTQQEVLKSESDKQVENLRTQQAEKKKAAEAAWVREKAQLDEQKNKLLTEVRKQTEADQKRLTADRDKIIAATNGKVTKLTQDNETNCAKILSDGKSKGKTLRDAAYAKAAGERSAGQSRATTLRNQAAAEQDEGKKSSLISQASGALSSANRTAELLEVKGRQDEATAIKESIAAEKIARGKGEKAIKDVKDTQETQINGIETKIKELAGLADGKIANAGKEHAAKIAAGETKIKKLIDDTDAKIKALREETEGKLSKLTTEGVQQLEKDYNAAVLAIDKRVEAARKQLAQGNEKNLKNLERMVNDTCKALDKQVVDTEKKFDSTIMDAEKKASAFVLAQLQKIKAEADKALKEIDAEFANTMKALEDSVKKAEAAIDETAKGKMLEIEVHTATLLADIGEGSRLDTAKQQLEWYIKNKQPIPSGYGEKPPAPETGTQKIAEGEQAKKEALDPSAEKKPEQKPEEPPKDAFLAAEKAAEEERQKLLDPNDLSPEGIKAKVEDQLKKGQSETASGKADEATKTIDRESRYAAWKMEELVKTKTTEQEAVQKGVQTEIDKVEKYEKSEKAGEQGAKEIQEALKKTNWYGGKKPDKAAILKAMEGKDETAIAAMKAELEKHGIKLEDMLKQELSGPQLEEALVRAQGNPMMGDLVALQNAQGHRLTGNENMLLGGAGVLGWATKAVVGDTVGEDKARIRELLERYKAEGKLDEFAAMYEAETGQSIQHLLKATDAQDIAKDLGEKYETKKDERSQEEIQQASKAEADRILKEAASDPEKAKKLNAEGAEQATRDINEALNGLHLDSTRAEMVTNALKGKTKEEIEFIKARYKAQTGRDLDSDMQGRLSGAALQEAKAHARQDKTGAALAKVMGSEDASWTPWTVDDSKMHQALKDLKDPEERRAVLDAYEKRTGRKLQDVIVEKMTGNDEKLALALAEGDAVKAKAIEMDEATNGGWMNGMHKAIAERTGLNTEPLTRGLVNQMISPVGGLVSMVAPDAKITIGGYTIENGAIHKVDSDKMFQLLEETPNPADRARIKALYKQQTGRDMDDDMAKSLVGPSGDKSKLDAYNAIQEGRMDDYYAARMDDSLSGLNDSKAFHAQLEGKPEWQRKQILDAWKKRNPDKSFDDVLNDQFGADSLDKQKAQLLANSKDDPTTGAVKLPDEFVLKYAQDSVWSRGAKWIDENTAFADKYPLLMMMPGISQAKAASYFMRGWGVDSDTIKNTLKGKSKEEIEALRKKYPDLDKDLGYVLSGRDLYEVQLQLKEGEPKTDEEKIKRKLALHEFDRGEGGSYFPGLGLSKISNGITDAISPSGALMDQDKEFLLQQLALIQSGKELPPEARLALATTMAGMETSTKHFQESRAAVTEAIATAVGVVVGAVVTVLTGGVAGAILAALATGAATVATKVVMLGQSYGRNEMGVDIAMTAVQMASAGIGGISQKFLAQVLSGAIGNAASSFVQTAITSKDAHDLLGLLAQATKSGLVGFVSGGAGAAVTTKLGDVMEQLNAKAFGQNAPLHGVFAREFITGSSGAAASMFVEAMADPSMLQGDWDKVLWNMTNTIIIQGGAANAIQGGLTHAIEQTATAYRERKDLAKAATDAAKEVKARGGSVEEQRAAFAKTMEDGYHALKAKEEAAAQKQTQEARDPDKAAEKTANTKPVEDAKPVNDQQPQQNLDPSTQKVSEHKTAGEAVADMKTLVDQKPTAPDEQTTAKKPTTSGEETAAKKPAAPDEQTVAKPANEDAPKTQQNDDDAHNTQLIKDLLEPTIPRPQLEQSHEAAKFEYEIERGALRGKLDKAQIALEKLPDDGPDRAKALAAYEHAKKQLADIENTIRDREASRAEWLDARKARDSEIEGARLEKSLAEAALERDPNDPEARAAVERAKERLDSAEAAPVLAPPPGVEAASKNAISALKSTESPDQRKQLQAAMQQVYADVRGRTPAEVAHDPTALKSLIDYHLAMRENMLQEGNHVSKVIGQGAAEKMLAGVDFAGKPTNEQTIAGFMGDRRNLADQTPDGISRLLGLDYDDKTYVNGEHGKMKGPESMFIVDMPVTAASKQEFEQRAHVPLDPDLYDKIRDLARKGDPQAEKLLPHLKKGELEWGDSKNPYTGFGMTAHGPRMGERAEGLSLNQEMSVANKQAMALPDGSQLKMKGADGKEVVVATYKVEVDPATGEKKGRFVKNEPDAAGTQTTEAAKANGPEAPKKLSPDAAETPAGTAPKKLSPEPDVTPAVASTKDAPAVAPKTDAQQRVDQVLIERRMQQILAEVPGMNPDIARKRAENEVGTFTAGPDRKKSQEAAGHAQIEVHSHFMGNVEPDVILQRLKEAGEVQRKANEGKDKKDFKVQEQQAANADGATPGDRVGDVSDYEVLLREIMDLKRATLDGSDPEFAHRYKKVDPKAEMAGQKFKIDPETGLPVIEKRGKSGDALNHVETTLSRIELYKEMLLDPSYSAADREYIRQCIDEEAKSAVNKALRASNETDFNSSYEIRDELLKKFYGDHERSQILGDTANKPFQDQAQKYAEHFKDRPRVLKNVEAAAAIDRQLKSDQSLTPEQRTKLEGELKAKRKAIEEQVAYDRYAKDTILRLAQDDIRYTEQSNSVKKLKERFDPEQFAHLKSQLASEHPQLAEKIWAVEIKHLAMITTNHLGPRDPNVKHHDIREQLLKMSTNEQFEGAVNDLLELVRRGDTVGIDIAGAEFNAFGPEGQQRLQYMYMRLMNEALTSGKHLVLRPHVGEGANDTTNSKHFNRDGDRQVVDGEISGAKRARENVEALVIALEGVAKALGVNELPPQVAVRFGHATHTSPEMAAKMAKLGIIAEVNLASNVQTGASAQKGLKPDGTDHKRGKQEVLDPHDATLRGHGNMDDHALANLVAAGVPVILSTDAHSVMSTDMRDQYDRAMKVMKQVIDGDRKVEVVERLYDDKVKEDGTRDYVDVVVEKSYRDLSDEQRAHFDNALQKFHDDANRYYDKQRGGTPLADGHRRLDGGEVSTDLAEGRKQRLDDLKKHLENDNPQVRKAALDELNRLYTSDEDFRRELNEDPFKWAKDLQDASGKNKVVERMSNNIDDLLAAQEGARRGKDVELQGKREAFERQVALELLSGGELTQKIDAELGQMCDKAVKYLQETRADSWQDAVGDLGTDTSKGYGGGVGKDPQKMLEIMQSGNIRERMLALGAFTELLAKDALNPKRRAALEDMAKAGGPFGEAARRVVERAQAYEKAQKDPERRNAKDFLKPIKGQETGPDGKHGAYADAKSQDMDTKLPPLVAEKVAEWLGTKHDPKGPATEKKGEDSRVARTGDMTVQDAIKKGLNLSQREIDAAGGLDAPLNWVIGQRANIVDADADFIKNARDASLPLKAGISGTTFRWMQTVELLGGNPELARLSAVASLQAADAHSWHEIAFAAQGYGLAYDPTKPYENMGIPREDLEKIAERAGVTLDELEGKPAPEVQSDESSDTQTN